MSKVAPNSWLQTKCWGRILVLCSEVPVFKGLPETGEYAPLWSGLFRPLRSPVHEKGAWILESGGEKGDAAGDFGAGSFPLDKKGCLVLGV